MAVVVSVGLEDDSAVVRHLADAADVGLLQRRAARLAAAAHPGVVRVLGSRPVGDGWEVVTEHVGTPLTAARVANGARLAAVGEQVATTLADLHERGVVHGHLAAEHVLIGADGSARLCGLGPDDGGHSAADDVVALAALLGELAESLADGGAAVAGVVAHTTSATTARRLGAELAAADEPIVRRRRPLVRVGAVLMLIACIALVVVRTGGSGRVARPPSTTAARGEAGPAAILDCVATAEHAVDDPACGFAASVEDRAVTVDGVRTVVGRPGDVLVVGDWDCDGIPTPTALRPGTGEVLELGAPAPDGSRPVVAATRVPGASRFALEPAAGGCPDLGVADDSGVRVPIRRLTRSLSS